MKIKKIVSFMLAAIMLISAVPVFAFAADTVSVYFSLSGDDNVIQKHKITVEDGIAEKYGYQVADVDHNNVKVNGATVFDAIVAAHKELYGTAFTKESAQNYLVMEKSFIKKSFGKTTASASFTVNKIMPNDGVINPDWGQYTSYASDTARIKDGDDICYFFYQDTKYYSDVYSWFDRDSYSVAVGGEVTVNLNGYTAMYYGVNDWETIVENYAIPLDGADVYADINGEKVLLGKTDANGNVSFSFAEGGEYLIYSGGYAYDEDMDEDDPVITSYATVKVADQSKTFLEKIKSFFESIKAFFVRIFNLIFKK